MPTASQVGQTLNMDTCGLTAAGGGELPTQVCPEANVPTAFKANDLGTMEAAL